MWVPSHGVRYPQLCAAIALVFLGAKDTIVDQRVMAELALMFGSVQSIFLYQRCEHYVVKALCSHQLYLLHVQ